MNEPESYLAEPTTLVPTAAGEASPSSEDVADECVIDDISIDGMCGVY